MLVVTSLHALADDMVTQAPLTERASTMTGLPILIIGATVGDTNGAAIQKLSDAIGKIDGTRLQTVMLATDHGFTDHRVEVTNVMLNWLDRISMAQ